MDIVTRAGPLTALGVGGIHGGGRMEAIDSLID